MIVLKYMIPNHKRPNIKQQKFIVHAINRLGYEPFNKPIHLYNWEEFKQISRMYREVTTEHEQIRHGRDIHMAR